MNENKVHYLNVAERIRSIAGVAFINTLTVEGGTVNVNLTGAPRSRAELLAHVGQHVGEVHERPDTGVPVLFFERLS